ncbi:MAG: nucleotidyltransferase domain-containing protein [Halomonas sp.]|uniref:nucleotidyltransferase domain-containing protein n=1 Tax=Halomonas sp. TaxID=1486246 RepID=UPI002ACEA0AB|nr:nucleotidyltransferase domain-containing protein [Halomonas sp.]MDZ7853693.1 nucleotidyltransferase domain-containing protein [Halomonas sp.]
MRLSDEQIAIIKRTAAEVFGDEVGVSLFGSRLEDDTRGGDIDLLVESPREIENKVEKTLTLTARLQLRIGDRPIDILVIDPSTALNPVHRHAMQTGQRL